MKLHLGCGTVYLKNYTNIDGMPNFLSDNVDQKIIESVSTTFENYYKYEFEKAPSYVVADLSHNLNESLPFKDLTVEEIVMFHVLEHFPKQKADILLDEIFRVLEKNGNFIVAVPDLKKTAELLVNSKTEKEENWAIRLIHGTQRNKYAHHYCGYTKRTLISLLKKHGFTKFEELPNINFYPAIHIKATKEK